MGGYPSTNIEWVNQSIKTTVPDSNAIREKSIMMTVCSSDKGYEDFRIIDGGKSTYEKIYGTISYSKHGQSQIQAAAILEAGAALYHKRVVSKDALLAHVALDITVTKTETQKTDSDGAPIYVDADGVETTAADGNTPVMIKGAKIKFGTSNVTGEQLKTVGNDPKALSKIIKASYPDWATAKFDEVDSIKFPFAVFTETGRGKSKKKVKITPDYASSKSASWTKYSLTVIENNESIDNVLLFSMDPDIIDKSTQENRFIDNVIADRSNQIRCVAYEDSVNRMFEYLASLLGVSEAYLKENDILFACTRKGYPLENIEIDSAGVSLNNIMGIDLTQGDDGAFGSYPIESAEYEARIVECFDGTATRDIYDINNRRINAIFDANYTAPIKRAIEGLVSFREDIYYFRDLGTDLYSVEDIIAADAQSLKSKFCASYHNSYDIYEPSSRKRVRVTCMYDLVTKFVAHEIGGVGRPFAGMLYDLKFTDSHIIQNSFNFIPTKLPSYDEIEALADARINYIVKYNEIPTMDTQYTSDEVDSDFSYINNILAIQKMIRLVRERCPRTRYTFKTTDSYDAYKKDVQAVLDNCKADYNSLELTFMADDEQKDDKAVYACITVECKDFIDKEHFKVIAI